MGAYFHRDVHFRLTVKAFEKGFWRGHHPFLQYDLSPFVQDAHAALFVAPIDSYISPGLPGRLFDILAHQLVSLIAPLGSAFYLQAAAYCMPLQETSFLIPSFRRLLGGKRGDKRNVYAGGRRGNVPSVPAFIARIRPHLKGMSFDRSR